MTRQFTLIGALLLLGFSMALPMHSPGRADKASTHLMETSTMPSLTFHSGVSSLDNAASSSTAFTSKRSRKRVQREERLNVFMNETLPRLEERVKAAKDDIRKNREKMNEIDESLTSSMTTSPSKPLGLLKLKQDLNHQITNTRRMQDPRFNEYIERVQMLLSQLPNMNAPKRSPEEVRQRHLDSKARWRARNKAKKYGVEIKAGAIKKGRPRGYSEDEPGYKGYQEIYLRAKKRAKERRLMEMSSSPEEMSEQEQWKFPNWAFKKPRTQSARE